MSATETGAAATLDEVASSVAELTKAVDGMKAGQVDEQTVRNIAEEAARNSQRAGYQPDPVMVDAEGNPLDVEREVLGKSPADRMAAILGLPAAETAPVLKRDVEVVENFRQKADDLLLITAIMNGQSNSPVNPTGLKFYGSQFLPAMNAAVDTVTTGEGKEFVPRDLSSQLIERVNLELRVLALFPEMVMPTNPFDIPARGLVRQRLGSGAEATGDSGNTAVKKVTAASRKITLTAAKFWGEILVSKEAEEDSIIAVLDFLREELVDFLMADLEDCSINGDTAGTHRDDDSNASGDPRKNWEGLRKLAATNSAQRDHGGGDLNVAGLRANRKAMGKYGINPGELAHIVGLTEYIDLLSDSNVITVDKYGANATLLSGELGRADGAPLVVSEYVREDLDANGVRPAVAGTKTVAITANRKALLRGTRRTLTVEYLKELYSEFDQDAVKVSTRQALTERWTGAKAVAVSRNVDAT